MIRKQYVVHNLGYCAITIATISLCHYITSILSRLFRLFGIYESYYNYFTISSEYCADYAASISDFQTIQITGFLMAQGARRGPAGLSYALGKQLLRPEQCDALYCIGHRSSMILLVSVYID